MHGLAASPSTTPLTRARSLALAGGGVLFAVGNLMHPLQHNDAAYDKALWELAHVVILVGIPLILFGLPVVERALRDRGRGRIAVAVTVLSIVGYVGMAPGLLVEAFIAPEVGYDTMKDFESGGFGTVSAVFAGAWIASLPVLSLALRKARIVPPVVAWSFLVAGVVLFGVMSSTSKLAGALIIGATAVYGLAIAAVGVALVGPRAAAPATMRPVEAAR